MPVELPSEKKACCQSKGRKNGKWDPLTWGICAVVADVNPEASLRRSQPKKRSQNPASPRESKCLRTSEERNSETVRGFQRGGVEGSVPGWRRRSRRRSFRATASLLGTSPRRHPRTSLAPASPSLPRRCNRRHRRNPLRLSWGVGQCFSCLSFPFLPTHMATLNFLSLLWGTYQVQTGPHVQIIETRTWSVGSGSHGHGEGAVVFEKNARLPHCSFSITPP